jgi:hypothetical protein
MTTAASTQAWTWIFLFVVSLILGLVLLFKFGTRHTPRVLKKRDPVWVLRSKLPELQYPYAWESYINSQYTGYPMLYLKLIQLDHPDGKPRAVADHTQALGSLDTEKALAWANKQVNFRFGGVTDYDMRVTPKKETK